MRREEDRTERLAREIWEQLQRINRVGYEIKPERQEPVADIQKRSDFPGVNIQPRLLDGTTSRVGHDDRKQAIHHVKDMEDKGYITPEEAAQRIEYIANAASQVDIRYLTNDLPGPLDHRGYWQKRDWNKAEYYLPVLITGMFISLCSAVIPGVLLAMLHEFNTPPGMGIFIPLCTLGVIGFFTSLVLLVIKTSL